jgi:hypothetical protein
MQGHRASDLAAVYMASRNRMEACRVGTIARVTTPFLDGARLIHTTSQKCHLAYSRPWMQSFGRCRGDFRGLVLRVRPQEDAKTQRGLGRQYSLAASGLRLRGTPRFKRCGSPPELRVFASSCHETTCQPPHHLSCLRLLAFMQSRQRSRGIHRCVLFRDLAQRC